MARRSIAGALTAKQRDRRGVNADIDHLALPVRTAAGSEGFKGSIPLLLRGQDPIARESRQIIDRSAARRKLVDCPSHDDSTAATHRPESSAQGLVRWCPEVCSTNSPRVAP